jgi:LmeA-like phospholipid-binding
VVLLIWLVRRLALLALVLAIPLVIGELVARRLVGDAVASQLRSHFGGSHASVGFGSTPLLLQLIDGHIDANASIARVQIAKLPPAALQVSFDDVRLSSLLGLRGVAGSVLAHVSLGPDAVGRLLWNGGCAGELPPQLAADLANSPRIAIGRGRVKIHGDGAGLDVVPTRVGRTIDFTSVSAPRVACTISVGAAPYGLALAGTSASDGALVVTFRARGVRFAG